jgi:hypothetical protein
MFHRAISGFWLVLVMLGPAPAWAQATTGGIVLPGSSGQTCVQVQIAGQKPSGLNCLNQQLQQDVQGANPAAPSLPLSANSPSNQVGTFNEQGVAEQYGQNFGKSAIPFRPPVPVFINPLKP